MTITDIDWIATPANDYCADPSQSCILLSKMSYYYQLLIYWAVSLGEFVDMDIDVLYTSCGDSIV
jgi:hypothetical protein